MIRHIKVCLQESATDIEVETLIEWLQGVRCTGAVYEVREIRPTKHAPDVVESAASSEISTTSEVSASEADSSPATTQVM